VTGLKASVSWYEAMEKRMCSPVAAKLESATVCQPSERSVKLGMAPGEIETVAGSVATFWTYAGTAHDTLRE
jgi:hypothetical protein